MVFPSCLLFLPLLLTVAEAGTKGQKEAQDGHTHKGLSCPATDWLEEQLSYFRQQAATATRDTAKPVAPLPAAETSSRSSVYVELTEPALQFALDKQPVALVLYSDARCTDASPLAVAFVGVARAFARMSRLQPNVLFAKAVPEAGASAPTPGMRLGGNGGCELLLWYKQQTTEAAGGEAESMALPLPDGSTEDEIKLQIIKLAFPPSLLVPNKALLDQLLFEFPRVLVRFFPRPADIMPVPVRVLGAAARVPILDVYDPSVAGSYQVKVSHQLLKGPRGLREVFELDTNNESDQLRLIRALEAESATVLPLTSLTASSIFTEIRAVVFFFGGAKPAIAEDIAFTEAAAAWGTSLAFCSAVRPSALQSRAIDYLGLRSRPLPQVVIVSKINDPKLTRKFICPDILSKAAITQCMTDFIEGKLPPYYKTADPIKMQKGPVYDLVASRFRAVVLDSAQEVLLLVYSPSCPHSAIFMPVFEELAVWVANEESLLVARMDGTANEVVGVTVPSRSAVKTGTEENQEYIEPDPVSIHGYPVVIFFAKKDHQQNTKVPIVYTGPRQADALRNFVISQTALQAHEDL